MLKFFKDLLSIITLNFLLKKLDFIKNIYYNQFSTQTYIGFLCIQFVNMFAILFVFGLIYLSLKYLELDLKRIITMIIIFSTSFIVFYFLFNFIKYSKNTIIRFIQNTVINFICLYIIAVISIFLVVIGNIYCGHTETYKLTIDLYENIYTVFLTLAYYILKIGGPYLCSASAGGAAASAMISGTVGYPVMLAVIGVGVASGVVSLVIYINIVLLSNKEVLNTLELAVRISEHSNPDVNIIPSPDTNFINSPLEIETPLGNLVDVIFSYNMLELIIIILLLYIIFNRNILIVISKYIPIKYNNLKIIVNRGINANTKIMNFVIIILVLLLLIFKIVNLFFSYELSNNLDNYVNIYNDIKNSLVVITTLRKTFYNSKSIDKLIKEKYKLKNTNLNYKNKSKYILYPFNFCILFYFEKFKFS
uniref:hypothetical protein n=1 Tax=Trametes maxima TaxID=259368 RepID=UPI003002F643|nr:hypothetical protein [Trametes maxima]